MTFTQQDEHSPTTINYDIRGSDPGPHGFHVHEFGDNTNGCTSAGGHFNPTGKDHGDRTATVRHVGDLGNLDIDEQGNARGAMSDGQVTLIGPHSVVGVSCLSLLTPVKKSSRLMRDLIAHYCLSWWV